MDDMLIFASKNDGFNRAFPVCCVLVCVCVSQIKNWKKLRERMESHSAKSNKDVGEEDRKTWERKLWWQRDGKS